MSCNAIQCHIIRICHMTGLSPAWAEGGNALPHLNPPHMYLAKKIAVLVSKYLHLLIKIN